MKNCGVESASNPAIEGSFATRPLAPHFHGWVSNDGFQVAEHSGAVPVIESPDSILPITLEPSQSAEFKLQLLACRHAQITTFYNDGRVEHHPWDASRFSDTSNVMGNLRSRPEFRQGAWRQSGIVKVHVRIVARDG